MLSIGHFAVCSDLCKKAEPDQMPFGLWAQGIVLDGNPDPPIGRGNFGGKRVAHCKQQGCSAVSYAKIAEPIEMLFRI